MIVRSIEEIDEMFCSCIAEISSAAMDLKFTQNFEFRLSNEIPKVQWDSIVYPGVYLIEMKNNGEFDSFKPWIENFTKQWEHEDFKRKFVPNIKKKRVSQHTLIQEWIPIYIGKSKSIGKRFFEHLYLDLNRNTFALKLYSRPYFHNNYFRLSTIKIDVKSYDQIVPIIENTLRNKINPIIGKQ